MSASDPASSGLSREATAFLAVGGAGFVVDVLGFNVLRTLPWFAQHDPSVAKTLAVLAAMVVTYWGNRILTWRHTDTVATATRRREMALFVIFNAIGLGFSVVALQISHHVLGLTNALADNVAANVVGIGLGTIFRFWAYRTFVFVDRLPRASPERAQQVR